MTEEQKNLAFEEQLSESKKRFEKTITEKTKLRNEIEEKERKIADIDEKYLTLKDQVEDLTINISNEK